MLYMEYLSNLLVVELSRALTMTSRLFGLVTSHSFGSIEPSIISWCLRKLGSSKLRWWTTGHPRETSMVPQIRQNRWFGAVHKNQNGSMTPQKFGERHQVVAKLRPGR